MSTPASSFPQPLLKLVEHLTEKPCAVLTWVRIPIATWDFSPRVNFQCRLSYGHNGVRTDLCVVPMPLCGHRKILHALIEMSSAALAAAVPYPGKAQVRRPEFLARDSEALK